MPKETGQAFPAPGQANYVPLTPVAFLRRSAEAFAEKVAVRDGAVTLTYRDFDGRSRALARALIGLGLSRGDVVSVVMRNCHQMLEAHYGVPLAGGIINAVNFRLDAREMAYILDHSKAPVVIVDAETCGLVQAAAEKLDRKITVISTGPVSQGQGVLGYEDLLASAGDTVDLDPLEDEWYPVSLGYTSGTTGVPKGVLCHHRGAYLNSLGNVLAARLDDRSRYLWTLPMFHCNGWSHTWALTAVGGRHVCLPRIDPKQIIELIAAEEITHMCAAPIVMNMMLEWAEGRNIKLDSPVRILTGGAPPPRHVITRMEALGFEVIQIFGQTETTGPSLIWEEPARFEEMNTAERALSKTRQGYRLATLDDAIVADPATCQELPKDGTSVGELLLRGNSVMMGYLGDEATTGKAMEGGWFHTGDLAVRHPDGRVEIRDRAKDIVISGGENISCIEIEEVLYSHPAVGNAAIVARNDPQWGEHPCAFIELKGKSSAVSEEELKAYCVDRLAKFKVPKTFVFGPLPKTETGKIQKFMLREKLRKIDELTGVECP